MVLLAPTDLHWNAIERPLRSAPVIHHGHLLHTGNGTEFGTGLFSIELDFHVLAGVFSQRNPRISALLRAIMHQAVFADIQIACTNTPAPVVLTSVGQLVLTLIEPAEFLFAVTAQLLVDVRIASAEGF